MQIIQTDPGTSIEALIWNEGVLYSAGIEGYLTEYDMTTLKTRVSLRLTGSVCAWFCRPSLLCATFCAKLLSAHICARGNVTIPVQWRVRNSGKSETLKNIVHLICCGICSNDLLFYSSCFRRQSLDMPELSGA